MKNVAIGLAMVVLLVSGSIPLLAQEKGPVSALVKVPNVVGMLGGQAKNALKAVGLAGVYVTQMIPTSNVSQNAKVASQSPAAGIPVAKGTTVQLTLYKFVEGKK